MCKSCAKGRRKQQEVLYFRLSHVALDVREVWAKVSVSGGSMVRTLGIFAGILVLLLAPGLGSADPVTWTFSGVTSPCPATGPACFDDGGQLSGSFVFNAGVVSSIDIKTTTPGGTAFQEYTAVFPDFSPFSTDNPNELAVVPEASLGLSPGQLLGTDALDLVFAGPLPDAGGTAVLLNTSRGGEGVIVPFTSDCGTGSSFDCLGISIVRPIAIGEVTAPVVTPTPEPSSFLLLGMGLATVLGIAKHRMPRVLA
jgi:hypothetical protein